MEKILLVGKEDYFLRNHCFLFLFSALGSVKSVNVEVGTAASPHRGLRSPAQRVWRTLKSNSIVTSVCFSV